MRGFESLWARGLLVVGLGAGLPLLVAACRSETEGGSDGTPVGSSPAATACDAGTTCTSALLVGTVSGDKGAATLSASGPTSTWLHVRVTEDDDGVSGRPVRLRAKLTAPSTGTFEVRAYLDDSRTNDAGLECTKLFATSKAVQGGAELDLSWGDPPDATANGVDDGRTVALEVRNVGGSCASSAPWRLELRGNP